MSHIVHCGRWQDPGPNGFGAMPGVDVEISDPPYSKRVHDRLGKETRKDGYALRGELEFPYITTEEMHEFAAAAAARVRTWIIIFGDLLSLSEWIAVMEAHGCEYIRDGVWVKTDPMPQMSGDRPGSSFEHFGLFHAPRPTGYGHMRWNGGGRGLDYSGPCKERGVKRFHDCQKPEWLIEAMLRDFSTHGDLVGDRYSGSGTTGVAAKRLGRRFVGWEAIPRNAEYAAKRIAEAVEQTELPIAPRPVGKPKKAEQFKLGI